jgi:hypothetical protein
MNTPNDKERARQLLMAALDGELGDEEKRELAVYMGKYPDLERELNEFKKIREITMDMKFLPPPDSVWDKYWLGVYNRLERGIGWILFSIGAIILLAYGFYSLIEAILADVEIEWWLKIAIFSAVAGAVVLLVSVLREKIFLHKSERYKDIQR